jgi:hypothetical protein
MRWKHEFVMASVVKPSRGHSAPPFQRLDRFVATRLAMTAIPPRRAEL